MQTPQSVPQHNIVHYGNYNANHQPTNMLTGSPMGQQSNFTDGIAAGEVNGHITRVNKGNGNNIQAVDMDVNEILKVCIRMAIELFTSR